MIIRIIPKALMHGIASSGLRFGMVVDHVDKGGFPMARGDSLSFLNKGSRILTMDWKNLRPYDRQ